MAQSHTRLRAVTAGPPSSARGLKRAARDLVLLSKGLSHPTRLDILMLLLNASWEPCGGIVQQLRLPQSTVSRHLKVLRDAGWLEGQERGANVFYRLAPHRLAEFRELLALIDPVTRADASWRPPAARSAHK